MMTMQDDGCRLHFFYLRLMYSKISSGDIGHVYIGKEASGLSSFISVIALIRSVVIPMILTLRERNPQQSLSATFYLKK